MKLIFLLINIILILVMIRIIRKLNLDHEKIRLLGGLYGGAIVTTIAYLAFLLVPSDKVAIIMFATYLVSTVWLIIAFFVYILMDFYNLKRNNVYRIISWIIAIIDTIYIYANTFNTKFLTIAKETLFNNETIRVINHGSLFIFHIAIVSIFILTVLVLFLVKIFKTRSIYRNKYIVIFISYMFTVTCALIHIVYDMSLNITSIFFIICASVISYLSGNIISKGLLKSYIKEALKELDYLILIFDIDNNLVYINKLVNKVFNISDLKDPKLSKIIKNIDRLNNMFDSDKKSILYKHKSKYFSCSYKKIHDKNNFVIGSYLVMRDETNEYKKMEAEKEELIYDHLTHMYNRQAFVQKAKQLLNNSSETYCLVYSDIKNFKLINDYYGSSVGDKILINFSNEIKRLFEGENNVLYGRAANDNFLILLPEKRLKKINLKKEMKILTKECGIKVFCYLGVYKIIDNNMSIYNIINNAIIALHQIKKSYRTFINYYDESQKRNIIEEQNLVSLFDDALKNNEFKMYLQPQVDRKNKIVGAEALVRWEKDGKIIPPASFLPVFEKAGIISSLDKFIWEEAAKKISEWSQKGINDLTISVNISVDDLYSIDIKKEFINLVNKYNIDSKKLKLELTETMFANNSKEIIELVDDLKSSGFIVGMDDFGSGYSSLNLLKDISADVVKLDMGFLYETENISKSKIIISRLMNLLKELGVEVVCEGVETKTQFDYLSSIDCDIFQGYFFDKPISVNIFEEKYMEEKNI